MKRFFIFALVLCLCMVNPLMAFAVEVTPETTSAPTAESLDYTNYDFPDDAIVLYQAEDIVVYQSKQKTVELQAADGGESEVSPMAMYYNGVWIDAGKWASGSFNVKNPHTLLLTTNGTLKLESDNPNAEVNIIVSGNASPISNVTIRPADGEVFFSSSNNAQEYVVWYNVWSTNNTAGMRVNCWLY